MSEAKQPINEAERLLAENGIETFATCGNYTFYCSNEVFYRMNADGTESIALRRNSSDSKMFCYAGQLYLLNRDTQRRREGGMKVWFTYSLVAVDDKGLVTKVIGESVEDGFVEAIEIGDLVLVYAVDEERYGYPVFFSLLFDMRTGAAFTTRYRGY